MRSKLHADLMMTPGVEMDFHQRAHCSISLFFFF